MEFHTLRKNLHRKFLHHIYINFQGQIINTKAIKFGALIGDAAKIGANAVLSPGSLIDKKQIVKRLELIEQVSFI